MAHDGIIKSVVALNLPGTHVCVCTCRHLGIYLGLCVGIVSGELGAHLCCKASADKLSTCRQQRPQGRCQSLYTSMQILLAPSSSCRDLWLHCSLCIMWTCSVPAAEGATQWTEGGGQPSCPSPGRTCSVLRRGFSTTGQLEVWTHSQLCRQELSSAGRLARTGPKGLDIHPS